jgi:hypothetical protein
MFNLHWMEILKINYEEICFYNNCLWFLITTGQFASVGNDMIKRFYGDNFLFWELIKSKIKESKNGLIIEKETCVS